MRYTFQAGFQKIVIVAFFCITITSLCVAAPMAEELSDEQIVALVSDKDFSIDAYQAQLESIAGDDYKHFQAVQERFAVDEELRAEAEAKRKSKRILAFILSLMIALFPTFVILKRVITGELQPAGSAAIWRTVGLLLFYGIVLFALNYAWLWCLFMGETKIMGAVLGLCLFAFVIYAIHTLRQYHKKNENNNSQKS